MSTLRTRKKKAWCIVVADDHGPEFVPLTTGHAKTSPVQYCGIGDPTTLLQKALHRAMRIADASQIAVTVMEDNARAGNRLSGRLTRSFGRGSSVSPSS